VIVTVPVKPEALLMVKMLPRGPLGGFTLIPGIVTVNGAEPTSGGLAESVITTEPTPIAATAGTVITAPAKVPLGAAAEMLATLAPELSRKVTVTGPVN